MLDKDCLVRFAQTHLGAISVSGDKECSLPYTEGGGREQRRETAQGNREEERDFFRLPSAQKLLVPKWRIWGCGIRIPFIIISQLERVLGTAKTGIRVSA